MRQTVELAEYESRIVRFGKPTSDDQSLAARLSRGGDLGARLDVRWLAGGRAEVKANSWVGVAQFSNVDVRVVPKIVGGPLRVVEMIEYSAGISLLERIPEATLNASGRDLFELIVRLFVEETNRLARDGLNRDYRQTEETLPVMRGRLRTREQFMRQYGTVHRLECCYDEYDGDIPDNQILAQALAAASAHALSDGLRADLATLVRLFASVCDPPKHRIDWYTGRIRYNRRNERYRRAHELATLVIQGLTLDNLLDTSAQKVDAFLIDMNVIFERFITRLVTDALKRTEFSVSPQESFRAVVINERTGKTYGRIRPDLVINDHAGNRYPVDVKYKLYSEQKISADDIYQTFLYAYALGGDRDQATAGLIFPATSSEPGPRIRIQRENNFAVAARILSTGVDVPSVLSALRRHDPDLTYAAIRGFLREILRQPISPRWTQV
ncbi:McrC family protein [Mycolicibacterium brumae]|nr:hypothetical protein [Mycolicibacterium brumae]MCV7194041.1 hypothetical protein [Mycolicibacterium brumae]UWW09713.1 McrC family protein [Mycolicibacterium brumae]